MTLDVNHVNVDITLQRRWLVKK